MVDPVFPWCCSYHWNFEIAIVPVVVLNRWGGFDLVEVRRISLPTSWSHSLLVKRCFPGDVISQTQLPGFQSKGLTTERKKCRESQGPGSISDFLSVLVVTAWFRHVGTGDCRSRLRSTLNMHLFNLKRALRVELPMRAICVPTRPRWGGIFWFYPGSCHSSVADFAS